MIIEGACTVEDLEDHPMFPLAKKILLKYLAPETVPANALRHNRAAQHSIRMHSALRALIEALET